MKQLVPSIKLVCYLLLMQLCGFGAFAQAPLKYCEKTDSLKKVIARLPVTNPEFVRLCLLISTASVSCNNSDDAVYNAFRAYSYSRLHTENLELQAEALVYYIKSLTNRGETDSAETMLNELEALNKKYKNENVKGQILMRRGMLSYRAGSYNLAKTQLLQALAVFNKTGNNAARYGVYTNLGLVVGYKGDAAGAFDCQRMACSFARRENNLIGMAHSFFNRAEISIAQGNYNDALEYETAGGALFKQAGVLPPADFSGLDIAFIYMKKKEPKNAMATALHYEKIVDSVYTLKHSGYLFLTEDYIRLSKIWLEAQNNDKALQLGLKALSVAKAAAAQTSLSEAYYNVSLIQQAAGRLRPALDYRDSTFNLRVKARAEEQAKAIKAAEIKYKTLENQREIENLQRDEILRRGLAERENILPLFLLAATAMMAAIFTILIILFRRRLALTRRLREQLAAENERNTALHDLHETKDRFFSLIAHDMRSPVIGFRALPDLYERCLRNDDRQMISELNRMFASSVSNMLSMLDSLLNWSQLQKGKMPYNPEQVNLRSLLQETSDIMQGNAFLKHITILNSVTRNETVYVDAKAIATACRNLLTHCIRHSDNDSKISCRSRTDGEFAVLEIEPATTCISALVAHAINRGEVPVYEPGSVYEKGSTLGLLLARDFARQNHGDLHVEPSAHNPAHLFFSLRLPKTAQVSLALQAVA